MEEKNQELEDVSIYGVEEAVRALQQQNRIFLRSFFGNRGVFDQAQFRDRNF